MMPLVDISYFRDSHGLAREGLPGYEHEIVQVYDRHCPDPFRLHDDIRDI